ncbi:MAG: hypothetical protein ACLRM8_02185 [Alistipes sp.]
MFLKGDGHDLTPYAALRKWKAETDYDMAWGWFGGWAPTTTNLKNSLGAFPTASSGGHLGPVASQRV